jgi:Holin of 3TMs, for gene-transfer release
MSALDFFEPIVAIINKIIPDKAAAAVAADQLKAAMAQGQLQEELDSLQSVTTAQSDINKVEAASTNWFVAGWRPAIGWVCGLAFGFEFLLRPLLQWGAIFAGHPVTLPSLDDTLTQLTYAMLGMGALRTVEKHPSFNKTPATAGK